MSRRRKIYEGKAKILYEGPEPGTLIQYFKDDATAFNAEKHAVLDGKGVLNNRLSEFFMTRLAGIGVPTHFIKRLNMPRSLVEFYYKKDELGDPMVSEEHIASFGWATPQEMDDMVSTALRVNDFLAGLFAAVGIRLVDMKLGFGRFFEGDTVRTILADEISPDSCRLWDLETNEKLDKDRFRRDMGGVTEAYAEVATRLGIFKQSAEIADVIDISSERNGG